MTGGGAAAGAVGHGRPIRVPRERKLLYYRVDVILPLNLLIGNVDNRYQLSAAAMRRAHQLALTGDEDVDANKGKIVSTSIQQILTKKVKYQVER